WGECHQLGVLGKPHDLVHGDVQLLMRIMRMRSDRTEDLGVALRDGAKTIKAANARRDADEDADTSDPRSANDRIEIGGEGWEIEMAVMIDQHAPGFCIALERPRAAASSRGGEGPADTGPTPTLARGSPSMARAVAPNVLPARMGWPTSARRARVIVGFRLAWAASSACPPFPSLAIRRPARGSAGTHLLAAEWRFPPQTLQPRPPTRNIADLGPVRESRAVWPCPASSRPASPSDRKLRRSGLCPRRSSSLAAPVGVTGWARIATCRTTSAVT